MSSSAVSTFNNPDDYASSIRATTAELTVIERGRYSAKLIRIDLHHLWMQRFSDNLPRIGHFANTAGRAVISFRTHPGPSLFSGGMEIRQSDILRRSEAQTSFQRSDGFSRYGSMSLPADEMASVGAAVGGCDLMPPRDALSVTPPPFALEKLRQLHEASGYLAEHAPEVIADTGASRGLEQALIGAMVDCFRVGDVNEDRAALRQHSRIMRRFRTALEASPDQAFFVPELCIAIGVSRRTFQVCCQEHLGVGPKRYLMLRRMGLVRRALRESAPSETTVTEIATRYGFWQFGRFAGEYKALFGELPSATLARQPQSRQKFQAGLPHV